jgi:MYXO-CTERM domain-containing protein
MARGSWARRRVAESGPTNSQSTAWAVQGLLAAGRNPASVSKAGHSPFDYLDARQSGDGHYRYSAASDQTPVWVTGQVLIAVSRDTFPIAAVPRAPDDAAGGGGAGGGGPAADGQGARSSPADGAQPDRRDRPARPGSGVASESVSGDGSRGTPATAFEQTSSEDDGPSTPQVVLGGLGVLAVLLAGGFFLYRRRLPM